MRMKNEDLYLVKSIEKEQLEFCCSRMCFRKVTGRSNIIVLTPVFRNKSPSEPFSITSHAYGSYTCTRISLGKFAFFVVCCCCFVVVLTSKLTYSEKKSFTGILSNCQKSWTQIRPDVLAATPFWCKLSLILQCLPLKGFQYYYQ